MGALFPWHIGDNRLFGSLRLRNNCAPLFFFCLLFLIILTLNGCHIPIAQLRKTPVRPLDQQYELDKSATPKHSDITRMTLRSYDLNPVKNGSLHTLVALLDEMEQNPTSDLVTSFVEMAYIEGKKQESVSVPLAAEIYLTGAMQAYRWLFSPEYQEARTPYNTRFHDMYRLYNGCVENMLRLMLDERHKLKLMPGDRFEIRTQDNEWNIHCELVSGHWKREEIDHFKFSYDYEITGIENTYRQEGLGVPLIATRRNGTGDKKVEKYYAPSLCFPVTAFLRPACDSDKKFDSTQAVLELYDPLVSSSVLVEGNVVPLQADLTTPIACYLGHPTAAMLPTMALLEPDKLVKKFASATGNERGPMGLYMMQPYQPDKIPVIMVHGLWSSPITWMEMFNTLQSIPEIRNRYQFWFYFYPSGQPFWISAAQLRYEMAELRATLDPEHQVRSLDEMVLIGHSMGGLVARLQVMDSETILWNQVSHVPLAEMDLKPEQRKELSEWFFFEANPSIRRVITIATPFQGSPAVNDVSQWFAQRIITIPQKFNLLVQNILGEHNSLIDQDSLLRVKTSIDSLSPDCPIYDAMEKCPVPRNVVFNNVVGVISEVAQSRIKPSKTDGIVPLSSSHRNDVESEKVVDVQHMQVHTHPATIHETRRILMEHLYQMNLEDRMARLPETIR